MMMMMLHTSPELLPPPSSPTISSLSSSDFDTVSTGSFFHDRSTTLGSLMGVTTTFRTITFRTPPQRRDGTTPTISLKSTPNHRAVVAVVGRRRRRKDVTAELVAERRRRRVGRRRWWWLCGGEGLKSKPSKLGEFLEVERRFGVEALFGGDVNYGDHHRNNGRILFSNGRVLPPPPSSDIDETTASYLCRFPVMLAGICCGGGR